MKNRVERKMMKDAREEVGTTPCNIVKSRKKWAGHTVRMKDGRFPKISEKRNKEVTQKEEDHS